MAHTWEVDLPPRPRSAPFTVLVDGEEQSHDLTVLSLVPASYWIKVEFSFFFFLSIADLQIGANFCCTGQ